MFRSGFVTILGRPNAGKSTLLNALIGEKLAIVSPKVQTTRHRIKGFMSGDDYQIIFSDTPGIINPEYKLHERMMSAVQGGLQDADLVLLLVDVTDNPELSDAIFSTLRLKCPALVVLNKCDRLREEEIKKVEDFFRSRKYCSEVFRISALKGSYVQELKQQIIQRMPEGDPYFPGDDLTDMPTRFFVGEMIREKIFELFEEEIPYHTTVMVSAFKETPTLIRISADIIVQRESQKAIILGERGSKIKQLGILSRKDIEEFLGAKVYLELFVKVRPKWRDNDLFLREYGYHS
jgi:GTP-binding protein Era